MKNTQIKNTLTANFLLERIQLENEISVTEQIIEHLNSKLTRLKKKAKSFETGSDNKTSLAETPKEEVSIVTFKIKAYTKKELRQLYGIPEAKFRRMINAVPETNATGRSNWLSPKQVEAIIKTYGIPEKKQ